MGDHAVEPHRQQRGLRRRLGDHRVDLPRHDRRAGLARRQAQLAEPRLGAGGEKPQVAADLDQRGGERLEQPRDLDEDIGVRRRLDEVLGAGEADAGQPAQLVHDAEDVGARRAEAGADGGPAEVHDPQPLLALVDPPAVAPERLGRGRHLASQRQQHGVLHLRAADLHDAGEGAFLALERLLQREHLRLERAAAADRGEAQGGGEGVVGGLVQVDVVERRDPRVVAGRRAEELQRAVGEDLVHVHVERGAGAAGQRVHDHRVVEPPFGHLGRGALDRRGALGVEGADQAVGPRAGLLDRAEGVDQLRLRRAQGEREVLPRARRVDAVERVLRHLDRAEEVPLDPRVAHQQ